MRSLARLLFAAAICAVIIPVQVSAGGKGKGRKDWMTKCGEGKMVKEEAFKGFKECMAQKSGEENHHKEETESTERRRRSPHEEGGEGGHGGKRKGRKGGWGKMKNTCNMVCQWKVVGVLSNDTSNFDESGCEAYIKRAYPEDKHHDMLEEMKKCNTEHSKEFSMDEKCKGYGPFKKCIFHAHAKVCGIKMGGGKKEGQDPPPPAAESEDE